MANKKGEHPDDQNDKVWAMTEALDRTMKSEDLCVGCAYTLAITIMLNKLLHFMHEEDYELDQFTERLTFMANKAMEIAIVQEGAFPDSKKGIIQAVEMDDVSNAISNTGIEELIKMLLRRASQNTNEEKDTDSGPTKH